MNVQPYGEILLGILCDLVENKGVIQFYSDYRGSFNVYCARLVGKLKERYTQIVNTMVLSYIPPARFNGAFDLPQYSPNVGIAISTACACADSLENAHVTNAKTKSKSAENFLLFILFLL
mgnify:CR=1 FL=1